MIRFCAAVVIAGAGYLPDASYNGSAAVAARRLWLNFVVLSPLDLGPKRPVLCAGSACSAGRLMLITSLDSA